MKQNGVSTWHSSIEIVRWVVQKNLMELGAANYYLVAFSAVEITRPFANQNATFKTHSWEEIFSEKKHSVPCLFDLEFRHMGAPAEICNNFYSYKAWSNFFCRLCNISVPVLWMIGTKRKNDNWERMECCQSKNIGLLSIKLESADGKVQIISRHLFCCGSKHLSFHVILTSPTVGRFLI